MDSFNRAGRSVRKYLLGRRFRIINTNEFASTGAGLSQQVFGDLNNNLLSKLVNEAMKPGVERFKHVDF